MVFKKLNGIRSCFAMALLAFPCLANGRQATHPDQRVYRVPILLSPSHLVFAKVNVDGKEVLALIDTGSSRAIRLSSTLARELNLSLTEEPNSSVRGYDNKPYYLKKGFVKTLAVGGYEVTNAAIEVTDGQIENIAKQINADIGIILGWEFLSQKYFVLDYKNSLLQFSDSPMALGKNKARIDYDVINHVPVIKGAFDKDELKLLFDTGAPICNIDSAFTNDTPGNRVLKEIRIGGRKFTMEWRVKDLTVIKDSLGCLAVIGNNFLGEFIVYFDTRSKVIWLY